MADSLRPFRKRLTREIGSYARIRDAIPPPLEKRAHDREVERVIQAADLSIHLLDQWPGREITDDPDTTYPRRQAELVLAAQTDTLVWVPESIDFEDEDQRSWIENLEERSRPGKQFQLVRSGSERDQRAGFRLRTSSPVPRRQL